MGSLKDEMRGLRDDLQPCEKADDGEHPGGSDVGAVPEGPEILMSQESTIQEDCQPELLMYVNYTEEEGGKNPTSKDQVLSREDCDTNCVQVKDFVTLKQQPGADKATTATHNDMALSNNKFLSDGDEEAEIQPEKDKSVGQDRENESTLVPVPLTTDPFDPRSPDPRSPAPFGQHHMRTQVSLEVVQCHSAATSPMTPPEGGNSFFFPGSFAKSGGVGTDTRDAELQVGQQVEVCSVATSPMTPKTPTTTSFPELVGRETVQKEEKVKKSEEQRESRQQKTSPVTKSPPEAESEITGASKFTTSKELTEAFNKNTSPVSSTSCLAVGLIDSQVTVEASNQQCKQQRMGSMDQDITILVTHYGNNEEDEEVKAEASFCSIKPEMVKIDEFDEVTENKSDLNREARKEKISRESAAPDQAQDTTITNPPQNKTEESSVPVSEQPTNKIKSGNSDVKEKKDACEEMKNVTKPPVPESPAPFGCHNIRTQVSLEVVQCQSAATSPMTPPEGGQAFYFPSSFGRCAAVAAETKDAELQVGQQVEFRSVATAPMTPRTPTTTTFPEIRKDVSIGEKILEEQEDEKEQAEDVKNKVVKEEDKVTEGKTVEAAKEEIKEDINCKEKGEEKCEEPVQEVSWDEKGMTWEVYGAVVEVAVLGSAIQKHLEKQVKKQKKQASMPPPPQPTPSTTPLASESTQGGSGSGKGQAGKRGERDGKVRRRRRNPFRLLMENMQQPHCCSRAHTTE